MQDVESEPELVRRAQNGDKQAFSLLVKQYESTVYGFAFKVCQIKEKAAETLQDTFVNAYRKLLRQLDGIPRNVNQAKLLEETIDVAKVIHLECTDLNKMVERLRRRALRENRFDDASDEVITRRLAVYNNETKPILEYYSPDKIVHVAATKSQSAC